jgi:hypothetical protein
MSSQTHPQKVQVAFFTMVTVMRRPRPILPPAPAGAA